MVGYVFFVLFVLFVLFVMFVLFALFVLFVLFILFVLCVVGISIPLSSSASALIVCRVWLRCLTYLCASVLLHFAHIPRRFDMSCSPPASTGIMWSTCVDGCRLQTVQIGCSRNMTPLFFRYSGCLCA